MSVFSDLDKLVKNNGSTNSEAKRKEQIKRNIKEAAGMKSTAPQAKSTVPSYVYKDAKKTNDWDLDRIRTFIKTEINAEPNGDPNQVWYNVDYGENQKEGKFYALKCHLGTKKQKTIMKAYRVDDLATYFFGPISEADFNGCNQNPNVWAKRCTIWSMYYNRQAWVSHINSGVKQVMKHVELKQDDSKRPSPESVFDPKNLNVDTMQSKVDPNAQKRKTASILFDDFKKPLMSAIAQQIAKDALSVTIEGNSIEDFINGINNEFLKLNNREHLITIERKYKDVFDTKAEVEKMIEAVAQKIGEKMPVYRVGQWVFCKEEGSTYIDLYSTNKEKTMEIVTSGIRDMCNSADNDQLNEVGYKTKEEYIEAELAKVFCYRLY